MIVSGPLLRVLIDPDSIARRFNRMQHEADPAAVSALGSLRNYGRNGPFRGERCRTCPHAGECRYYFDMRKDPLLEMLYEEPSREDGYVRDACVFREDIDIFDTMTAAILYESGVQVSYSLNTFMPIEGYHLAFNGRRGRIEIRQYEKQAWPMPDEDEILLARNFGPVERTQVVDAAEQRPDVGLRLVELACRGLGGGQRLQELPEEAHVGVVTGAAHSAVVKLIGGELFELFASRHDRSHTGNASAESASVADRRCARLPRLCLQLAGMSRSTWGPPTRSSTSADAESCCPSHP